MEFLPNNFLELEDQKRNKEEKDNKYNEYKAPTQFLFSNGIEEAINFSKKLSNL